MDALYYNCNILTMEEEEPRQAMLVTGGRIRRVGTAEELFPEAGDTERIDLRGATVLPAFLDAHSHLASTAASFWQVNLGEAVSFPDLTARLDRFRRENNLQAGDWLIADRYDHNRMTEKCHPGKTLLDTAFPGMKVVLQHQSGHFGVFSTPALEALGMTGFDRDGYLEEVAYIDAVKALPMPSPERILAGFRRAMEQYASYGITTVQEGMMVGQMLPLYRMLLGRNAFLFDVVGYPAVSEAEMLYRELAEYAGNYCSRFRLGGVKIILDGSPQGKTAWVKEPYTDGTRGVSSMTNGEVRAALEYAAAERRQILTHCNGDAAVEQLLRAAEGMTERGRLAPLRPVIVHAQLMDPAQLPHAKSLGFLSSFFVAHLLHWGDVHTANLGRDRAARISPAGSALRCGIPFTFHTDTPVIRPDLFESIYCAVNRRTKTGEFLGAWERIPVWDALRAVTLGAAYQYGEEREKGSLRAGKRADFLLLAENPLTVPPEKLGELRVKATYRAGECIYDSEKTNRL